MNYFISAMLILVAIIHLLPVVGFLGAKKINDLYGINASEPNTLILLRHRSVLFGMLGIFIFISAFRPEMQIAAFISGFVSVSTFIYLALTEDSYNKHISRVVLVDIGALFFLSLGGAGYFYLQLNHMM